MVRVAWIEFAVTHLMLDGVESMIAHDAGCFACLNHAAYKLKCLNLLRSPVYEVTHETGFPSIRVASCAFGLHVAKA